MGNQHLYGLSTEKMAKLPGSARITQRYVEESHLAVVRTFKRPSHQIGHTSPVAFLGINEGVIPHNRRRR
jgi:hypothetical protein